MTSLEPTFSQAAARLHELSTLLCASHGHKKAQIRQALDLIAEHKLYEQALELRGVLRQIFEEFRKLPAEKYRKAYYDLLSHLLQEGCRKFFVPGNKYLRLLGHMAAHWDHAKAPVCDWVRRGQHAGKHLQQLVELFFVQYPLPTFLQHQIDKWGYDLERFRLALHIGSGQSIRKFEGFRYPLSKKMVHPFFLAPLGLRVSDALRYALVIALGGTEEMYQAIRNQSLFWRPEHEEICRKLVQYLVRNKIGSPYRWRMLFAWVGWKKYGYYLNYFAQRNPNPDPDFSLKGRSPQDLFAQIDEALAGFRRAGTAANFWQREMAKREYLRWSQSANICHWQESESLPYAVVELTDTHQLQEEGQRMRHCVGEYSAKCVSGRSSIWSLRQMQGLRSIVTVEVDAARKTLLQIKGPNNRRPAQRYLEVIYAWAKENNLSFSPSRY